MQTGLKTLCLTLSLLGLNGCSPAHAAPGKAETSAPSATSAPAKSMALDKGAAVSDSLVSINTASAEELAQEMNGVGQKKAQSIVSYREEFGPYKSLEQLQEVPGIGAALVERNRSRIKL